MSAELVTDHTHTSADISTPTATAAQRLLIVVLVDPEDTDRVFHIPLGRLKGCGLKHAWCRTIHTFQVTHSLPTPCLLPTAFSFCTQPVS